MDALIAGAGLSGCIAALMLRRAGADCVVVERSAPDRTSIAALHAHRFSPGDLDACAALAGVAASRLDLAGRGDLLDLLRRPLRDDGAILWSERIETITGAGARWSLTTRSGKSWRIGRLIDASGSSFALSEKLAAQFNDKLDVSQIRDGWTYRSWRLARPARPGWSAKLSTGLAFAAPDRGAMIVTLAEPGDKEAAAEDAAARAGHALGLDAASLDGDGDVYRGGALARTVVNGPVLRIGDSLLRTPPRYGDGLSHALETARLACADTPDLAAAAALDAYASQVWSGAILAMALEQGSAERGDASSPPIGQAKSR